MVAIKIKMLQ